MSEETFTPEIPVQAFEPQFTEESLAILLKAAKWAKFLAILGFIMTGLLILAGIVMTLFVGLAQNEMMSSSFPVTSGIMAFFYLIFACIYIIPVVFLFNFSSKAIKAIQLHSTFYMTSSIKNLKNLFVFIGILTIILIFLYMVILLVAGITAAFMM